MAKRQRKWARRAYEKLILQLGGKCVRCGKLSGLSVHHKNGRSWNVAKVEWSARISIYRKEAAQGLLEVLCVKCNSFIGDPTKIPDFDQDQLDLFVCAEGETNLRDYDDSGTYVPPEDAPF